MVKLIRMKANSTDNNSEINNTFKQPLIIEPNSRIALAGLEVDIASRSGNATFTMDANTNSITVDNTPLTLPNGSYSLRQFQSQTRTQLGLNTVTWRAASGLTFPGGMDYGLDLNAAHVFNFLKFKAPQARAKVKTEYQLLSGTPASLNDIGTITCNAASPAETKLNSFNIVPNSSFQTSFVINKVGGGGIAEFDWSVRDNTFAKVFLSIGIDADGVYSYQFNDGTATRIISASNPAVFTAAVLNDKVVVNRSGTELTINIYSANRTQKAVTTTLTVTETIWEKFWGAGHCYYFFEAPQPSQASITNIETSEIDRDFRGNSVTGSVPTTLNLTFGNERMALYYGFLSVGPLKNTGDPASITGPTSALGDNQYPGLMVTVDPFILESYDGASDARYQSNILYVIHDTKNFGHSISTEITPHIALSIRNDTAMSLNQMRIAFRNSVSNAPLTFVGQPVVTLVIYGPDE